jgi:hypothetical protein
LSSFKALARSLPNVVDGKKLGVVDSEVRDFTIDVRVAKLASDYNPQCQRIDSHFWSKVL